MSREFNAASLGWRFAAALGLVLLTFNPTGYSFFHWLSGAESLGPEHLLAGIALVIGWAIFLVATSESFGIFGMLLAAALLGALVWLLVDIGLLRLGTASTMTWVVLVCLAAILAIGMSWSHIWRRMTGQFDVDDTDG